MNSILKSFSALVLGMSVTLLTPGCGESSESDMDKEQSANGHDHDHGENGHEDHAHDESEDAANGDDHNEANHDGDEHGHGEMRSLGSVEIAGATFDVSVSASIEPASDISVEFAHTAGTKPAALRFWVGDEAATGVMKSKADGHESHYHGHTEAPASMDGASLWIEFENANGERTVQSIAI